MTFRIIEPNSIGDAQLLSSTVTEDDYDEWSASGGYSIGDFCMIISTHKIYECMVANTNKTPETAANIYDDSDSDNITGYWSIKSATNKWKMLDGMSRAKTIDNGQIVVSVSPSTFFNSIALLNIDADSLTVVIEDAEDGVVYRNDIDMVDNSNVNGWFSWFFESPVRKTNFVLTDLPAYVGATVTITAENEGGFVEIGELIVGRLRDIGSLNYGYNVGITDWSVPTDTDGVISLTKGSYRQSGTFSIRLKRKDIDVIRRRLEAIRQTGVVFVGHEEAQETIVYGFYSDFTITAEGFKYADCALDITELS